ncbi:MAG: glycosyltransferase [Nitrospirae bacterium]|nr:glycosyltransferase [Nitrospirota bacterium]
MGRQKDMGGPGETAPGPIISIIITTKNEEHNIANCLESIKRQTYPRDNIEIISVDNDSTDRTKEIASRYTDKVYNFGPERSAQRNFGVKQATGKYLLYLDADMILSEDVIKEGIEKCENEGNVALYIPERIVGKGFWVKVRDFERGFYNATVIDCVRFVRRDKFLELGGFDENLTGPEDWDFDRRIRRVGKVDIVNSPIYHNEEDFNLKKYLDKKNYYSQSFDKYITKWGKDDAVIKKQLGVWYRLFAVFCEEGKGKRLLRHPLLALGMLFLRFRVGVRYVLNKKGAERTIDKNGILIISPFFRPNIGGVETYLDDLCEYLRNHGYMVYVLTYQPLTTKVKGKKYEKEENLEIRRVSWFGCNLFHKLEPYPLLEFLYLTPFLLVYIFFFLVRNHRKIKVIHAQGLSAAFIAKFLAKFFKKRSVMSTCAVYNLQQRDLFAKMVGWVLSGFDKILPLADFSKQELIYVGLPEHKMNTYYLWVNQEIYKPGDKKESKESVGLRGKFIVLFIGRLIKMKGVEILIEVAGQVNKKINFVFIGDDGPLLNVIETAAAQSENIVLVKGLRGRQLIPYYQAADILVIPSQYEEAFGKVIIEALSCGTPVIGADKGAIPDILDVSVGRVIAPTTENIKREVEYFYCHPDVLSQLTVNCRPYAEKYFGEKNAEIIAESYCS